MTSKPADSTAANGSRPRARPSQARSVPPDSPPDVRPGEARASDYKALVCVFLYGGNDGLNTVTPTDMTRYNQYAAVRGALALPQSSLVGLAGSDYGLHPAMKP